jgi:VWFA-related protein
MTRTLVSILWAALFLAAGGLTPPSAGEGQTPPQAQSPSRFRTGIDAVTVDVVVADRSGQPVPGLTRADFTVLEDGRPQTIAEFQAVELPAPARERTEVRPQRGSDPLVDQAPSGAMPRASMPFPAVSSNAAPDRMPGRAFVIVFDDIGLTRQQADVARDALGDLIDASATSQDSFTLAVTSSGAWYHSRRVEERERLLSLLSRVQGKYIPDTSAERMTDYEALRIHQYQDTTVAARVRRRYEYSRVAGLEPPGRDRDDMPRIGETPGNVGVVELYIESRAMGVYGLSAARTRTTLELLTRAVDALRPARGRKSVILLSKGFVYDTEISAFKAVSEAARRANVAIYFIDAQGLVASTPGATAAAIGPTDARDIGAATFDLTLDSEGAVSVAEDSGGFAVRNTNDLSVGIRRIATESRIYYLIGYVPPGTRADGRFHRIEVRVKRPGVTVRARKGYFAAEGKPGGDKPIGLDPDVRRALDAPREFNEVPMRATALVFDRASANAAKVLLAAEVDIRAFALEPTAGRLTDVLEFAVVATHLDSSVVTRFDQTIDMNVRPETLQRFSRSWYSLSREFELAPGAYRARIVARDRNSGKLGSLTHDFVVPSLDGFRVSSPIVTDALVTDEQSPGVPKAVVQARRTFVASSTLYCQFTVYGAMRDPKDGSMRVTTSWSLGRADGSTVRRNDPRPMTPGPDGALVRLYGIRLATLTPGSYQLLLSVRDEIGVRTTEVVEPFVVEPGVGMALPSGGPGQH